MRRLLICRLVLLLRQLEYDVLALVALMRDRFVAAEPPRDAIDAGARNTLHSLWVNTSPACLVSVSL